MTRAPRPPEPPEPQKHQGPQGHTASFDFFAGTEQQPRPRPPDVEPRPVPAPQAEDLRAFPSTHSLPNLFGTPPAGPPEPGAPSPGRRGRSRRTALRPGRTGRPDPVSRPGQAGPAVPAGNAGPALRPGEAGPVPPVGNDAGPALRPGPADTAPLIPPTGTATPSGGIPPAAANPPTVVDLRGVSERRPPVRPPAPVARPEEFGPPAGRRPYRLTHRLATWQETLRGGRRPVPRAGRAAVARHHVPGGGSRTEAVHGPGRTRRWMLAGGGALALAAVPLLLRMI
jgi:hypothetical protein